ncbi:glycosyltransferase [Vibrio mimicus]|uniref:glycosyltransferase n=1 Tax=Vibrio mimicus TaxID=674 RepID=UPI0001BAD317|nr:glycosyltransferase [Vibrio mimicus]EEY39697.1 alpha-1,4-N-acetylgalactosamine transferase PglH [Vibrio mimicus MB451]
MENKLAFLCLDISKVGGVEKSIFMLTKELEARGVEVNVYTLSNAINPYFKIKYTFISNRFGSNVFRIIYSLFYLSFFKKERYVVTSYFLVSFLACLLSPILRIKVIVQEHSSYHYDTIIKRIIKILCYRLAYKFVVLNNYDKKKYQRFYLSPCVVRNLYVRSSSILENYSTVDDYYLFIGRMDQNKQPETCLSAYELYLKLGGKANLIFLGDGERLSEIKNMADGLDTVHFLGNVENVQSYLSKARGLIITSKYECLPTVILEAFAESVPVIALARPSGTLELVEDGVNGFLAEDIYGIAQAMNKVDSDKMRDVLSQGAKISYTLYDNEEIVNFYIKCLELK